MINPSRYHVFCSYNEADAAAVETLARRLREQARLEPFLDQWHLIPGMPRQEELERALDQSASCAVFLGRAQTGAWEYEQMRLALDERVDNSDYRVIPVLLPGAQLPERGRLPRFLARLTWVDFRAGLDDAQAFHALVSGILGVPPEQTDPVAQVCPFRGLHAFDEESAAFFFGREALTQQLIEQLRSDRFLAVVGASGSGKSSLVRAGLIAQLKAGALPGSAEWSIVAIRPGANPLDSLAARLLPLLGAQADPLAARASLLATLQADERGLHRTVQTILAAAPEDRRVLLLVDQFEELFTLCRDPAEQRMFVDNLLYASSIGGGAAIVVLTIRGDFIGKCADYAALAARIGDRDVLVGPMDAKDLRRAMLGPAEKVGLHFEKGLIETILDDLGVEAGRLPLLQHLLWELWHARRGAWLTSDAYHALDGVRGALAQRAETVYGQLSPQQQHVARRIFLRLTRPGEGTEDTRQRVELAQMLTIGNDGAAVEHVVAALVNARLLITDQDEAGSEIVDVAHETLIRGWPRLQQWVADDRLALRLHQQLTSAALQWARHGRDPGDLYRGARLIEAEALLTSRADDLNQGEHDFLRASLSARAAEQRRVRRTIAGLVAAVLLVSAAALTAFVFYRNAHAATQRARSEEQRAAAAAQLTRAQLLVSEGQRLALERPLLGLRLVLEGIARSTPDSTDVRAAMTEALRQIVERGRLARLDAPGHRLLPSPDGSMFVLVRQDGPDELRRAADGQLLQTLRDQVATYRGRLNPDAEVYEDVVEFSASGDAFVVFYRSGGVELRRTESAQAFALPDTTIDVDISPDGRYLLTYSNEAYERTAADPPALRSAVDGRIIATLPIRPNVVQFDPDGARVNLAFIFSENEPAEIEVRRLSDGVVLQDGRRFAAPNGVVFISAEADGRDALHLAAQAAPIVLSDQVEAATFNADGSSLVVDYRSAPDELRWTDRRAPVPLSGEVDSVTFNRASTALIVRYTDVNAEVRAQATGATIYTAPGDPNARYFDRLQFVSDGEGFLMFDGGTAELRRTADGNLIREPLKGVSNVQVSPGGKVIAVDYEGLGRALPTEFYRAADGARIGTPEDHADFAVYGADDLSVYINYREISDQVWSLTGTPHLLTNVGPETTTAFFAPGDQRLLVNYRDGHTDLFDLAWLSALSGASASASLDQLTALACQGPLASELWSAKDQADLLAMLGDEQPQACR